MCIGEQAVFLLKFETGFQEKCVCFAMLNVVVVVVVVVVLVGGRGLGTRFSLKGEQTVRKFPGKVSENCLLSEERTIIPEESQMKFPLSCLPGNSRK